jgi:hypothetical protein
MLTEIIDDLTFKEIGDDHNAVRSARKRYQQILASLPTP